MITVRDSTGRYHYLAAAAIARVTEAPASSQWHGIRAFVTTFDGQTIESSEVAADIARNVEADRRG